MNILKKEPTFNRWLVWVEYTEEETCLLEIPGLEEPSDEVIEQEYNKWVEIREQDGTAQ